LEPILSSIPGVHLLPPFSLFSFSPLLLPSSSSLHWPSSYIFFLG
jgi:hypothetical protein